MACKRCPHHVRHGKSSVDGKSIEFSDHCGLRLKQAQEMETGGKKVRGRGRPAAEVVKRKPLPDGATTDCIHVPFDDNLDYFHCAVYQDTFDTKGLKNGVVPTKDFQYSERLAGIAVTDMELL